MTKQVARLPAAAVASTLALLLLGQCRRQEVAPSGTTPVVANAARAPAEPAPTPAAPPAAAEAEPDTDSPPPSKGSWLEGNIYRFRLDDVRKCPPPSVAGGARIG